MLGTYVRKKSQLSSKIQTDTMHFIKFQLYILRHDVKYGTTNLNLSADTPTSLQHKNVYTIRHIAKNKTNEMKQN